MNHTIITLAIMIAATAVTTPAAAQENYRFGNVTKTELEDTTVPATAEGADMVILNKTVSAGLLNSCMPISSTIKRYRFFRYILYSDMQKVKIVNPTSGTARISIILKNNETFDNKHLQARHYSMRNSNVTQKKYTHKNTEETVLPNGDKRIDLTITNAKAGDIVEYCYTKVINLTKAETYDLQIQQNIPILNTRYIVYTVEPVYGDRSRFTGQYYKSITTMGKYPIIQNKKAYVDIHVPYEFIIYPQVRAKYHYKSDYIEGYFEKNTYDRYSAVLTYEAGNLPAITSEPDNDIAQIRIVFDPKEYEQFNSFMFETVVVE